MVSVPFIIGSLPWHPFFAIFLSCSTWQSGCVGLHVHRVRSPALPTVAGPCSAVSPGNPANPPVLSFSHPPSRILISRRMGKRGERGRCDRLVMLSRSNGPSESEPLQFTIVWQLSWVPELSGPLETKAPRKQAQGVVDWWCFFPDFTGR